MRYFKIIVGTLVVILLVVFILQNKDLHRSVRLGFGWDIFSQEVATPAPDKAVAPAEEATKPAPSAEEAAKPAAEGQAEAAPQPAAAPESPPAAPQRGVDVPVFILIFLAFFLGLIVASATSLAEKYRLKRLVKTAGARVKALEEEITTLRNMPLTQSLNHANPALEEAVSEVKEEEEEEGGQ